MNTDLLLAFEKTKNFDLTIVQKAEDQIRLLSMESTEIALEAIYLANILIDLRPHWSSDILMDILDDYWEQSPHKANSILENLDVRVLANQSIVSILTISQRWNSKERAEFLDRVHDHIASKSPSITDKLLGRFLTTPR